MNAKNTIDKLILCYQLTGTEILDKNYLSRFKIRNTKFYDFGKGIMGYLNSSKSNKEREITKSFTINLQLAQKDIGTLFITNANSEFFYFKYHKSIFYEGIYKIQDIKNLIDNLFDFKYEFRQITRLEIACDTITNTGNDLFVIADLCSENLYFKSVGNSARLQESIDSHGGRIIEDARYSLTLGNTKIYHHTKFEKATCIGDPKSKIFMRCYNKSSHSESYQTTYFQNVFPEDAEIYRLEVSLNSEAIKDHQIQFYDLEKRDYLKYIYLKTARPLLTFNDLKSNWTWKNRNKVFQQICLVDHLDFGEPKEDINVLKERYSTEIPVQFNPKSEAQIIREKRSRIGSLISQYLRNKEQELAFNQICEQIETENFAFDETRPNKLKNLTVVNKMIDNQIENNNIISAITVVTELKNRLSQMVNAGILDSINRTELIGRFENERSTKEKAKVKTKVTTIVDTTTIKEIEKQGRPFGIVLKKLNKTVTTKYV
jgi:hypothetical protein